MRRHLCSTLAVFAVLQPAVAADLHLRDTLAPVSAEPSSFTWTGFYLGLNAGYVGNRNGFAGSIPDLNAALPGSSEQVLHQTSDGFTGGGQLGYTYALGARGGVVLGIEADLAYTDTARVASLPVPPGLGLQATYRSALSELGTVRGRLGYAAGPLLVYGTGGFAFGEATRQVTMAAGGATLAQVKIDDLDVGYAVGGGVEWALVTGAPVRSPSGAVTVRGEYLHYALSQDAIPFRILGQDTILRMRNDGDLGRVGVNYKF